MQRCACAQPEQRHCSRTVEGTGEGAHRGNPSQETCAYAQRRRPGQLEKLLKSAPASSSGRPSSQGVPGQ